VLSSFQIFAPARITLFLHVTGRQDDGLHQFQTVMAFLDVGDTLTFAQHGGFLLETEGDFASEVGSPHQNFVYIAAKSMAEHFRLPLQAHVVLQKNLPVGSGVGGASSDMGATLMGLHKLWRMPEDASGMEKIARSLAFDVPACFTRRAYWAEGVGDKNKALEELPPLHFVLVNPMETPSTTEVFRRFNGKFTTPLQFTGSKKTAEKWIADLRIYRNDLTDAAISACPAVRDVLSALETTPHCQLARLSGTGATCFGLYQTAEQAQLAAHQIQQQHPNWWVTPAGLAKALT
jgi:4-diphosphocytidyl-2-C-methyl-D-erythritol kinase